MVAPPALANAVAAASGPLNILDPAIVGGAIGAVAAILGAIIGGLATYLAATAQYRSEYKSRKWDALRAVAIEIHDNQPSLFLDLDRSLPAWLARAHTRGGLPLSKIEAFVQQSGRYKDAIYKALLAELVTTRFGSELVTYFSRIEWLNVWTADESRDLQGAFNTYIRMLANSILLANQLLPAIEDELRGSHIRSWGMNREADEFRTYRDRYEFAARLAAYDLQTIEEFIRTGKRPNFFPELLAQGPTSRFDDWIVPARACSAW